MDGIIKPVGEFMARNAPQILTGVGIGGFIFSTILAVKATPKAILLLEEKGGKEWPKHLTKMEVISTGWRPYLPAAFTTALSIVIILSGTKIGMRRYAALSAVLSLTESSLQTYQEKVASLVGEKLRSKIDDGVIEAKYKETDKNPQVILTGKGTFLCFDTLSGRHFRSDIETIRQTVNKINERVNNELFVCLNDFYSELGLDVVNLGYDVGWSVDRTGLMSIHYGTQLTEEGEPCIVLDYLVSPKYF